MSTWFKIALRNLIKNKRRSLITIIAIALGYAAVNLFGGFTEYMYNGNREGAIYGRARGHLNILKKGYLQEGQLDPGRYLLTPEDLEVIREVCREIPHIILVTPQITVNGLVSNGRVSTIFIAQGIVPSALDTFWSRRKFNKVIEYEGSKLRDDLVYGVGVARGMARLIDLQVGSNAVVLTNTVDGQTNALDIEVVQLVDVDVDTLSDKVMIVPFAFAQSLYDTQGAERMVLLLDETEFTESTRVALQERLAKRGYEFDIKTWNELSQWYTKVKEMFDIIFLFLFIIVFIIVTMSVVNTMSMAVLERTREIGTLRALGLKLRGVLMLFSIESSFLGLFGILGGMFLTFLGWWWVDFYKPMWIPPGISRRVPLMILFVPEFMVYSSIMLLTLCLVASLVPARRGARQNVVDALGHV